MVPLPIGWSPLDDGAVFLGLTFIIIRVVNKILDSAAGRDGKASRKLPLDNVIGWWSVDFMV